MQQEHSIIIIMRRVHLKLSHIILLYFLYLPISNKYNPILYIIIQLMSVLDYFRTKFSKTVRNKKKKTDRKINAKLFSIFSCIQPPKLINFTFENSQVVQQL